MSGKISAQLQRFHLPNAGFSCRPALVPSVCIRPIRLTGMPKEKYEPPDPRRLYTIMSAEEAASGKKSYWAELEITVHPEQLPQRPWITLRERDQTMPTAVFTVMCYNVLCDKYATRQLYGYCPSWALNWEYRKKGIMEEITSCDADIISLQEVETEQYYTFFLETLKERGYDGYFCPKSRAKLVSEQERKHVDGCAVFFKTEKFALVQKHTVEFNQVAMANSEGSEVMLNRVMTKDNIGVAVLLEVKKELFGGSKAPTDKQLLLVANAHMHWDPEYSDVKLIQTVMFLSELKSIVESALSSTGSTSASSDSSSIPIVLCADLNSLPDSGVVEYLSNGGVAENHKDFKELRYSECLNNFSCNGKNGKPDGSITHSFQLKSAYESNLMPYTNYTYDFKGVIDYIFFSKTHMNVLGLLGPLDTQWLVDNCIIGCPHPHIPSDHFSLLAQLEYHPPLSSLNGLHLPIHR
ncbi:CCR4-NOT transcription complex subunit 6-like isoform X3 [Silurus asotus]|uniref:poly(A)-specific ribonuclease n=1 Tax=Silurus asotus TaxID=30991 RepID=A0AAD5AC33_SILAS|nr:CCR4-NOT transcription complex subunit 6-like isoform X3 [Silurus asotus]